MLWRLTGCLRGRGSQRAWEKGTFPFPKPQPLPPFSLAEQSRVVCCRSGEELVRGCCRSGEELVRGCYWSGEELVRGCCWLGEDGVGCCLPGKEDEEIDAVFREKKRGGCYWPGEEARGCLQGEKDKWAGCSKAPYTTKKTAARILLRERSFLAVERSLLSGK